MDKRFENITMTGRMCYIFMCIERYLVAEYVPKWDGDGEFFDRWGMPTLGTEKLSIILKGNK